MAITLNDTTLKNTIGDAVIARLNAGSTNATGRLVFQTSGNTTLSTNNLSNPPAGSFSGGTVTFSTIANATISTSGTVAKFLAQNRDATTIFTGTVTVTGGSGDLQFNTVTWSSGDTASISSLTLTV